MGEQSARRSLTITQTTWHISVWMIWLLYSIRVPSRDNHELWIGKSGQTWYFLVRRMLETMQIPFR